MNFSKAGLKEAVVKAVKVIAYVAVSGAITSLINYFKPMEADEYGIVFTAINSGLAFLQKWLSTSEINTKK
jgi:hypothetical protein